MVWGTGATQYGSMKKMSNTRSITKAEVFSVDDMASKVLWTKLIIKDHKYNLKNNIFYLYNNIFIILEKNGCKRVSKRSWAMNIRFSLSRTK